MTTVIEEGPVGGGGYSGVTSFALMLILLVGIALGIAYMNGAFTAVKPGPTVIENRTIEHKTEKVIVPIEKEVLVPVEKD